MNATSEKFLVVEDVSKYFGGLAALKKLDLEINSGEILGLIGPNGSGKTTFFNVLTGIFKPTGGSIHFNGRDVTGLPPQSIYRAGIARTFQRSRMCLPLSIFDNIMIGNHIRLNHGIWYNLFRRKSFARDFVAQHREASELLEIFNPELAEHIFEAAGDFPMIDRRRMEICRALISRPRLLLLDEPSAGMTHDEMHQLMNDILKVRAGNPDLTIIIIEHEMNVIESITDHCVVLNFGEKICEGTYQEIASDRHVQEAYLGGSDIEDEPPGEPRDDEKEGEQWQTV